MKKIFKKIILLISMLIFSFNILSANDKNYININNLENQEIDNLGWKAYKCRYYKFLLEFDNRKEPFKNWIVKTYYKNEYDKLKDDDFALNELKYKSYKKFIKKIDSLKVNCDKYGNLKGNYIYEVRGKLNKYNFDKEEFALEWNFRKKETKEYNNTKLVKLLEIHRAIFYLKANKDEAKKIHSKYKDKDVIFRYKFHTFTLDGDLYNAKSGGPWAILYGSMSHIYKTGEVEVIDPNDNSLIGIAK